MQKPHIRCCKRFRHFEDPRYWRCDSPGVTGYGRTLYGAYASWQWRERFYSNHGSTTP